MKGYKGFTEDMTCHGHKYTEGKVYKHNGPVELCESGFHFCELPNEVFHYYPPGESVFHKVEAEGVDPKTSHDSKRVASELRVDARIDFSTICKIAVSTFFTRFGFAEKIKAATANVAGDNGAANAGAWGAANAGAWGAANAGAYGAANAGDRGAANAGAWGAANAGAYGAANAGDRGAANAGAWGAANAGAGGAANAGNWGTANTGAWGAANAGAGGAANAGAYGAANAGDRGAANAGNWGVANAGNMGAASVGEHGIAIVSTNGKVRGKKGALLILTKRAINGKITAYDVKKVDGKVIKADTWYRLVRGKFVKSK